MKFLEIPVLYIVAPLSIAEFTASFWLIPAWFGGLIAGGALLYYIPNWVRARQGIQVGFVYKELPPE